MTNEIALKLCPFCGDKPRVKTRLDEDLFTHNVVTWTGVYCTNCDVGFDWPPDVDVGAVEQWNTRAIPAQGEPVATEQIDAGAQALANDVWHPPQKLENMTGSEANKFRRQARIVLVAALSLVKP